jgi:hypothetical protein
MVPLQVIAAAGPMSCLQAKSHRDEFKKSIARKHSRGLFERPLFPPFLWEADKSLTSEWTTAKHEGLGKITFRCGLAFEDLLYKETRLENFIKDPEKTMLRLLEKCVPHSACIFVKQYAPLKMFQKNEYVFEKTFVYAMLLLQKWLPETFCSLLVNWPPRPPKEVVMQHLVVARPSSEQMHVPVGDVAPASTGTSSASA